MSGEPGADAAPRVADPGGDGRKQVLSDGGFMPGDDRSRVAAYQARWQTPLDLLALMTTWFVVVPPGQITSNHDLYLLLWGLRAALSVVYAVDIGTRTWLAPHHAYYLRHNLLSVLTVVFPFLRVVFSLRLLRSIFQRGRLGRFVVAAGLMFLNLTAVVYLFERHAPNANIKSVGNALWWAVVTLTTVGYGDYTPVTWQGRTAAVLLMFVGFAVLATLTAQISSAFIDQAARARAAESRAAEHRVGASAPAPAGAAASAPATALATAGADPQLQAILDQLQRLEARIERSAPSA